MSKCADFTIKANNKPLITIQAVVENIYSINEVESDRNPNKIGSYEPVYDCFIINFTLTIFKNPNEKRIMQCKNNTLDLKNTSFKLALLFIYFFTVNLYSEANAFMI